jgi:hypothetical protein
MPHLSNLTNCESALELIKSTDDKTLRNLLDMAFMEFIRVRHAVGGETSPPQSDFDMAFCMNVLKSFFSNRELLKQVLSGAEPEAWFDESASAQALERVSTLAP